MAPNPDRRDEEARLVQRTLDGDPRAFAELYRRRARLVVALCYDATGSLDSAGDLAQEVFLRAYARLRSLRDPKLFAPWLLGVTRHVIRESRRARGRYDRHVEELARQRGSAPDATRDHRRLRDAVALLPEQERLALHAFYLEGCDADAVAHLLGVSRAKVYRLLEGARAQLRELLETLEMIR